MISYSISILSTYVKQNDPELSNVLERVTWMYKARDGLHVAELFKDTLMPSPDENNFVNFYDLTEELIIDWVLNLEDMEALKTQVTQNLERSKNSTTIEKALPWNTQSDYTENETYIITKDDSIVFGPAHWNSGEFNKILLQHGFKNYLPVEKIAYRHKILPINQPLNLSENLKIYQAITNEQPILDNNYFKTGTLTWSFDTGKAIGDYKVLERSLPEVQSRLLQELANKEKVLSETSSTVKIGEYKFEVYPTSLFACMIISKMILMSDQDVVNWYEGTNIIEVNRSTLTDLLTFTNQQIDILRSFIVSKTKEINECKTLDQLKKIVI